MFLRGFSDVALDPNRLEYYRDYARRYYYGAFLEGQGVEQILEVLAAHGRTGTWLDLGAGTSTLFWSIPLAGITSITTNDVYPEPLKVLDEFARSNEVPECYKEVLQRRGKPAEHLTVMRRRLNEFVVFDALQEWPPDMAGKTYDLITEFGCFGVAPSGEAFVRCFGYFKPYLKNEGKAVGANWVRSKHYVSRHGGDNSYLSCDLVRGAAQQCRFEVLHCENVPIAGDPDYDAVIVWALQPQQ